MYLIFKRTRSNPLNLWIFDLWKFFQFMNLQIFLIFNKQRVQEFFIFIIF